ncbi:MAG: branched-chain amino acid transport system substrate-binding protein [Nocardioidaceae bacterium]|jgi:branched-chain amino acid transport system substrate-binding protein|nr:branched-chain amino acid transport system substrate-binding protein [Nocardioidaceae bacterium]
MRLKGLLVVVASAALALSACGSSDKDPSDDGGSGTITGTPAEGTPVKIGFFNTEAPQLSLPDYRLGAEAAVKYINASLGGLAGRPIELVECKTLATPDSTTACANKFLAAKVSAVVAGADSYYEQMLGPTIAAGIPYITGIPSTPSQYNSDHVYVFQPGVLGAYRAFASYAADKGWEDFVFYTLQSPALTDAINNFAIPAFKDAGVKLHVIEIPPTAADFTPYIAEGAKFNPGGWTVTGAGAFCPGVIKGFHSAVAKSQLMLTSTCLGPDLFKALGDHGIDGAIQAVSGYTGDDTKQGALYLKAMKQFAPKVEPASSASIGWALMVGLTRVADAGGLKADDTSAAALEKAIQSAKDVPAPLGQDGRNLTCDGKAVAAYSTFCSNDVYLVKINGPEGREFLKVSTF